MPMLRWDPFTALARLDEEFDEVVRRTFGATPYQWVPPVEMATEGTDVRRARLQSGRASRRR